MKLKAEEILERARMRLLDDDCPYWGILHMGATLCESQRARGTMSTDGESIFWDRQFVESLTIPECEFVLAHESGIHKGLLHHIRLRELMRDYPEQGINLEIFNIAADLVGNNILLTAHIGVAPKGALIDPGYANMTVEQAYWKIMKDPSKYGSPPPEQCPQGQSAPGQGGDSSDQSSQGAEEGEQGGGSSSIDPGRCGSVLPSPNPDLEEAIQEALQDVRRAIQASDKAGNTPGNLSTMIKELLKPVVDWKSLLREFLDNNARSDFSYQRPNKKYVPMDIYMPEIRSMELGDVVGLLDASGSCWGDAPELVSEMLGIVECFPGSVLYVIPFDTRALDPIEIDDADQVGEFNIQGLGGGTDYVPAFEKIAEALVIPKCVVVITDGYCDDFPKCDEYPTLWVIAGQYVNRDFKPPFGTVVYKDRNQQRSN